MAETLAMKDKRDAKRERDNYAVKLRKEKRYVLFFRASLWYREELQKRRRNLPSSQTSGQGSNLETQMTDGGKVLPNEVDIQQMDMEAALNYQK